MRTPLVNVERMGFIEGIDLIAADLEDGAYFAIMEENGITLDELAEFAEYLSRKEVDDEK